MSEVIITQDPETTVAITASGNTAVTVGDASSSGSSSQRTQVSQAKWSGDVDGINTFFETTQEFIEGTLEVYYNGNRQVRDDHFKENSTLNGWEFLFVPEAGSTIIINITILS